jgi:hypothetical protein
MEGNLRSISTIKASKLQYDLYLVWVKTWQKHISVLCEQALFIRLANLKIVGMIFLKLLYTSMYGYSLHNKLNGWKWILKQSF